MYFFLILFFISLCGIILMIGRKLVFADLSKNKHTDNFISETFDLDDVKHVAVKNAKKYGFILLVTILRISIRFSYFIKTGYKIIKGKIINKVNSYFVHKNKEPKNKEVSSFLKMVSDYKYRIRQIRHQIKEEEGIE